MKRLLSITLLIFALTATYNAAVAQQHGPTKLGAGIIYGSEIESAGIQIGATFRVSPQVAIAPDIGIYFPDDDDASRAIDSFFTLNVNGHYIFEADQEYHFYALGGINISTLEFEGDDDNFEGGEDSESELGLNLGVGGEYHLDKFSLFSEIKYIVSDFDQVVLAVGARIPIN